MTDHEPEALLRFQRVGKRFHGVPVLGDVSLTVGRGRIVGLVGENGAGKSTLMNILGGVHQPDTGAMLLDGTPYRPAGPRDAIGRGVAFIHQELNLFPNLSIAENLGIDRLPRRRLGNISLPFVDWRSLHERGRSLLQSVGLDLSPTTPVHRLSPGHRQLIEIARAVGAGARLLILDEPTTSLSAPEIEKLFQLLSSFRAAGVSMIFISHNLGDVLRMCDDLAVLRNGSLVSHGPRNAYTRERLLLEMAGRPPEQPAARDRPVQDRRKTPVLEAVGLSCRPSFEDVSFTLGPGEVLGLAGLVGAGRTELARAIFGIDPLDHGTLRFKGQPLRPSPWRCIRAGMGFLTEDRREDGLMMDAAIADNAALVALRSYTWSPLRLIDRKAAWRAAESSLKSVRFRSTGTLRQPAWTLSGGNQQKVVLTKWLLARPSLLIVDEPTRGIDVSARQEVHAVITSLASQGAGVIVISSEIDELITVCDRILVMASGRIRDELTHGEFDPQRILRAAFGATHPRESVR